MNVLADAEDQFDRSHSVNAPEVKRRMTSMFDPKKRRTTLVRKVLSSACTSARASDLDLNLNLNPYLLADARKAILRNGTHRRYAWSRDCVFPFVQPQEL